MVAPKGNKYALGERKYTDEFIEKEAEALLEWCQKKDSYYLTAFSLERGYSVDLVCLWARKNAVFAKAHKIAKEAQQVRLVNAGLTGKTNPGFTRWVLACNFKWKEPPQEIISRTSLAGAQKYIEDMEALYATKDESEASKESC